MSDDLKDKLEVYKVIYHERMKLFLAFVAVLVFITLFIFFVIFVCDGKLKEAAIMGGSDFLFAIIIIKVYSHYFK